MDDGSCGDATGDSRMAELTSGNVEPSGFLFSGSLFVVAIYDLHYCVILRRSRSPHVLPPKRIYRDTYLHSPNAFPMTI